MSVSRGVFVVTKRLPGAPYDPAVMALAREMAIESRDWGRIPVRAIRGGYWDNGEIVQVFVRRAEVELIRNRPEAAD